MKPRKRKRLLIAFAGIVAVVAGLFLFLVAPDENEPVYKGRTLSEWVQFRGTWFPAARPDTSGVIDPAGAIQFIGTNALPFLVDWIAYEPSRFQVTVIVNSESLPKWIGESQLFDRVIFKEFARSYNAMATFAELGSRAAPAIPDLTRLIHSTNTPSTTRSRALSALCHIGPEAFPIVLGVVSNLSQPSDLWMLDAVMQPWPNLPPVIPVLLPQLQNTNLVVAVSIAQFLDLQPGDSELIARALGDCLEDPRWEVRAEAANSLMRRGNRDAVALLALVKALEDTNATVRANAAAAINRIDPSALPEELRTPASPP